MNSFAALMGSLTGAGISGVPGAAASGTSPDGLFAGLLEAGPQAGLDAGPDAGMAAKPLNGEAAGAGLRGALGGKDGAATPGMIDLATLLQATTDAQGTIAPADSLVAGLASAAGMPMVPTIEGQAPEAPLPEDAEPQEDASETAGPPVDAQGEAAADRPPAHAPDGEGAPQPSLQPPSTATAEGDPGAPAPAIATMPRPGTPPAASGHDGAPGRDSATAARSGYAQPGAPVAGMEGIARIPGGQPGVPPGAAAPSSVAGGAQTQDPQQAAKAAHLAANMKAAEDAALRLSARPAAGQGGRAGLTDAAGTARTLMPAPNAQAVLEIIRSGKADSGPAAGIDQHTTGIHVRPAATPPPSGAQQPQAPLNGIAVHIAQQAANGARRFDIRLDPPELGRVEVRLDVSKDGKVSTHLVVERTETLDLLQRDARALERALQNAGLDTSDSALKFSLKDQGGHQAHSGPDPQPRHDAHAGGGEDTTLPPAEIDNATRTERRYVATGGLDIRI